MARERYRHVFLTVPPRTQGFTNPRHGGPEPRVPTRNREQHSAYLRQRLQAAWVAEDQRRAVAHIERHGAYIDFVSEPGFDLALKSLEYRRSGIRLLNVRREGPVESERIMATVYVPCDKRAAFLKKIGAYAQQETESGKPKNQRLIESVSDIRLAVLESFWQDEPDLLPGGQPASVEVWLSSEEETVFERFTGLLSQLHIEHGEGRIRFPERTVLVVRATRAQLEALIEASDDVAEFRLAKEVASFFIEMQNREQLEWARDVLSRTDVDADTDIAVCILDAGVNRGHLLIQPVLAEEDLHTVDPAWGTDDHDGHGTLMAGIVAYGDLLQLLQSADRTRVSHVLESAKILPPPPGQNPRWLWGDITAQGLSLAEIQAPNRKRIACMAVTSTDFRDRGRPSSWSGMLDELSSGQYDGAKRLFVVSAGNVENRASWLRYFDDNLTNEVHDPGQAWNVLTAGAYTEKVLIEDPTLQGWESIAPAGGLSPYSTTSSTWPTRKWPIKPDVLFEGGNVAKGPNDSVLDTDDLKLLSTYRDPQVAQFAPFCATSAAAAQAARMAAVIQARYPEAWPETVRALIVHTAEWTDTMMRQFLRDETKASYARLLRVCGYGVPNLERALYCASNSLTLISQAELQPYDQREARYVSRDMHLYDLPWPSQVLLDLGETPVEMRMTLSYFIEPGPGEVGWQDRYRYPSHALRFEVNGPGESEEEFVRRVNMQAREDGEHPGTEGPGDKWVIGEARNVGSIHSDIWKGAAADLAGSNRIAIFPAVGWWRERHHLGRWSRRCRYSLVVSIRTPLETVDIYTPVVTQIAVQPIQIPAR